MKTLHMWQAPYVHVGDYMIPGPYKVTGDNKIPFPYKVWWDHKSHIVHVGDHMYM